MVQFEKKTLFTSFFFDWCRQTERQKREVFLYASFYPAVFCPFPVVILHTSRFSPIKRNKNLIQISPFPPIPFGGHFTARGKWNDAQEKIGGNKTPIRIFCGELRAGNRVNFSSSPKFDPFLRSRETWHSVKKRANSTFEICQNCCVTKRFFKEFELWSELIFPYVCIFKKEFSSRCWIIGHPPLLTSHLCNQRREGAERHLPNPYTEGERDINCVLTLFIVGTDASSVAE